MCNFSFFVETGRPYNCFTLHVCLFLPFFAFFPCYPSCPLNFYSGNFVTGAWSPPKTQLSRHGGRISSSPALSPESGSLDILAFSRSAPPAIIPDLLAIALCFSSEYSLKLYDAGIPPAFRVQRYTDFDRRPSKKNEASFFLQDSIDFPVASLMSRFSNPEKTHFPWAPSDLSGQTFFAPRFPLTMLRSFHPLSGRRPFALLLLSLMISPRQ